MAQQVQVNLVDDIDGGTAEESISFALDGVSYEIDLSTANAAMLREAMARWIGHARRVGGRPSAGRRSSAKGAATTDTTAARRWARANGYPVSDRGRLSAEVLAAYEASRA